MANKFRVVNLKEAMMGNKNKGGLSNVSVVELKIRTAIRILRDKQGYSFNQIKKSVGNLTDRIIEEEIDKEIEGE